MNTTVDQLFPTDSLRVVRDVSLASLCKCISKFTTQNTFFGQ